MRTFNVMFYLKADKQNEQGKAPIYCRLTIDGKRLTFSTAEWITIERWKSTNRLSNSKIKEEVETRNELRRVEAGLHAAKRKLLESSSDVIPEEVLRIYRGENASSKTIIELCDFYLETLKAKVNAKLKSEGTLERYETVKKLLLEFILYQYKKSDYDINKLTLQFIDNFDLYMRNFRKCGNNTTVKYVQNIRAIILMGIRHSWLSTDPFIHYEGKLNEVETIYLTEDELASIENKVFSIERLNVVKDLFLFSCYTSYAPCDVAKLERSDIINHIDGEKWIFTDRIKTHIKSDVMIFPPAMEIIKKYENNPECIVTGKLLPSRSNQRLNSYLKEIADICGINKNLHYYVGRHTFAVTMLNKGVPIETISTIMGHKRLTTTQHYAKVTNLKVSNDLKKVKEMYLQQEKN